MRVRKSLTAQTPNQRDAAPSEGVSVVGPIVVGEFHPVLLPAPAPVPMAMVGRGDIHESLCRYFDVNHGVRDLSAPARCQAHARGGRRTEDESADVAPPVPVLTFRFAGVCTPGALSGRAAREQWSRGFLKSRGRISRGSMTCSPKEPVSKPSIPLSIRDRRELSLGGVDESEVVIAYHGCTYTASRELAYTGESL